jgi:hypothetical protein
MLLALLLPTNVKIIEPAADAKTNNEMEEVLLRNDGKYDEKILTFSDCDADGFDENVEIHKVQMIMGINNKITPAIDIPF